MKRPSAWGLSMILAVVGASLGLAKAQRPKAQGAIHYPAGYRHWTHLKSMAIVDKSNPLFEAFGGIHHVYVNDRGLGTLKKGGSYPDGSVFVFDLLEAKLESGAYVEGSRKVLAVMVKDAKQFGTTGGWGFQAFAAGDRKKPVVTNARQQCFDCHAAQRKTDYVFSVWRP